MKTIGVIKAVTGEVTATSLNGSVRTLVAGDSVSAHDLITTQQNGSVEISFDNGHVLDLGRHAQIILDKPEFLYSQDRIASEDIKETTDQLINTLPSDGDLSELLPPTAASVQIQDGNEGHQAIFVDYGQLQSTSTQTFFDTDAVKLTPTIVNFEEDPLYFSSATDEGNIDKVVLYGTAGNDLLSGHAAAEILVGGGGDDILIGGGGSDLFVWMKNDDYPAPAEDTVKDFRVDDVLDISDLLSYDSEQDLSDFLKVIEIDDGVMIHLTPTGQGEVTQKIILEDVSLADLGVTTTSFIDNHFITSPPSDVS